MKINFEFFDKNEKIRLKEIVSVFDNSDPLEVKEYEKKLNQQINRPFSLLDKEQVSDVKHSYLLKYFVIFSTSDKYTDKANNEFYKKIWWLFSAILIDNIDNSDVEKIELHNQFIETLRSFSEK